MAEFQEALFRDLWCDVRLNEAGSLLCAWFREEKRRHPQVAAARRRWAAGRPGPPEPAPDREPAPRPGGGARRCADEDEAVRLLCAYYDSLSGPAGGEYPARLLAAAQAAKTTRARRDPVLEEVERAPRPLDEETAERLTGRVMDLYLYAQAAQFLYNAGFPLPRETGADGEEPHRRPGRIKSVPLGLLDRYFARGGWAVDQALARSRAARTAADGDRRQKLADVYAFACENGMTRAVVPLLVDNASGAGLYVLGRCYLGGWRQNGVYRRRVRQILGDRPCCYAIVRFLNLELEDDGVYFWAPYSVTDPVFGRCDMNPAAVLFTDLDRALNLYEGQLRANAGALFYENFRSENLVHTGEEEVWIDPEFRRYFCFSPEPEDLDEEKQACQREYRRRLAAAFPGRTKE